MFRIVFSKSLLRTTAQASLLVCSFSTVGFTAERYQDLSLFSRPSTRLTFELLEAFQRPNPENSVKDSIIRRNHGSKKSKKNLKKEIRFLTDNPQEVLKRIDKLFLAYKIYKFLINHTEEFGELLETQSLKADNPNLGILVESLIEDVTKEEESDEEDPVRLPHLFESDDFSLTEADIPVLLREIHPDPLTISAQ
ncbi:MAG: hypothetical protein LBS83_01210 [Holosporales bacterium]|jgi:hypothetical protein|nr:hypothetical protein [Holosporales bacterium]